MSRVWLTGDAVVDLIPDGQQHYLKCPGGAPANVAVAIARLSGRSAFFWSSRERSLWPIYATDTHWRASGLPVLVFRPRTSHFHCGC